MLPEVKHHLAGWRWPRNVARGISFHQTRQQTVITTDWRAGGLFGNSYNSRPVVPGGIDLAHKSPQTGRHPQSMPDMCPWPLGSSGHSFFTHGLVNRHSVDLMEQFVRIGFSTHLPNRPGTSQIEDLQGGPAARGTPLAEPAVVPPVSVNASGRFVQVPLSQMAPDPEEGQSLTPQPGGPPPINMEVVNKHLQEAGLPAKLLKLQQTRVECPQLPLTT